MNSASPRQRRRPKGTMSSLSINHLHRRTPWVAAWWSAAFPGFGQILLGNFAKGYLLFIWEVIVNNQARLNTAILYSLTGRSAEAAAVLDRHWLLLYCTGYVYSIWDSYRTAIILNTYADLADWEKSPLLPVQVSGYSVNFLFPRPTWLPAFWSFVMPGLGQTCIGRYLTGFFLFPWWLIVVYHSHLLPAFHLTAVGSFRAAVAAVDPQWLLYVPSLLLFAAYDAYVHTAEYNRLFAVEQARFLRQYYQSPDFPLP